MAEIAPQEYRMVAVRDLKPHPDNPHRGDIDVIVASIRKHGFYGSVVAQKSRMRIIAGEHRWRGATKAGLKHVPTVVIDVDDETAKRIMLADNRLAEYGEYDDGKLAELLQSLPDLDGTGWREEDLADILHDLGNEIEIVQDEPAQPRPAPAPVPASARDVDEDELADVDDDQADEGQDDEDEEDDAGDVGPAAAAAPPPRPKAGALVELIVPLTAAQHDEVTGLIAAIRARDGAVPLADVVVAALRTHAERQR
ncbi:ParB/RepB/Spo0J family partition protein [Nonomuraea maritima]|uniref:ParB/RepB/Spo0J family partition protein n=1 Tax=Nonomuraea maritima TaxID=683260 RepID=A0A1G9MHG2_9ACTN|nr:ParB N-terminal domain-containing protein [Nonomuraea maritima]SDL73659.1 ParB/RepB/Spo0J family partition protein [Nonomuraea maritima]